MVIIKKFRNFIKENVENTDPYKEKFFDTVQENMKEILKNEYGENNTNQIVEDIVRQFNNNIKNLIDKTIKDGAVTPNVMANQIIKKYYKSTKFNNKGELQDGDQLKGDRIQNKLE